MAILARFWDAKNDSKVEKNATTSQKKRKNVDFGTGSVRREASGRVLGGFLESFGRVWGGFWEGFGKVLKGFGEGLGGSPSMDPLM